MAENKKQKQKQTSSGAPRTEPDEQRESDIAPETPPRAREKGKEAPETPPRAREEEKEVPEPGAQPPEQPDGQASPVPTGEDWLPVVGVGASAGGLEALESMFAEADPADGLAYVVATHIGQEHTSMLPELLSRKTRLDVVEVSGEMDPAPGTIYVHPSERDVVFSRGRLRLVGREKQDGLHLPIDRLFTSLAEELGERCAVVVLSGTGTDGTRALSTVKERDGLILVQEPQSAKYAGMPESAIRTGLVDDVVAEDEMCRVLRDYFATLTDIFAKQEQDSGQVIDRQEMDAILELLRSRTGRDFSRYKKNTLIRRIQRRMAVTKSSSAKKYILALKKDPGEGEALLQDLLIGVTGFFRDPGAFEYLRREILPGLVRQIEDSKHLRVWVPGCASGEEAYSLAMLLTETVEELGAGLEFQVFATDIDQRALNRARQGLYPPGIVTDVSPERLQRFFTKQETGFQVRKELRDHIVFAVQDLLSDPPFTRLDMVACRNLLIYLESRAQKKLIPLFHYALNPGGILFLGSSESVGSFSELFTAVSQKWNVYRRREVNVGLRPQVVFPSGRSGRVKAASEAEKESAQGQLQLSLEEAVQQVLVQEHTPPAVVVDEQGEIAYVHGRTGKYLEHSQGRPSANVHSLAREGLRFEISSSLRRAVTSGETVVREHLLVGTNGGRQHLALKVQPLSAPEPLRDMYLLLFLDRPEPEQGSPLEMDVSGLERETREHVQEVAKSLRDCLQEKRTLQEELETTTEELRSSNEELQSSNEELQSTNEELESSREELLSLNEELSTVNAELEDKMDQLSRSYENVTALFNSTRIPIVFLDRDQRVTRFTGEVTDLVSVIEKDIGRPVSHLTTAFDDLDITQTAAGVLETLEPVVKEVQTKGGDWYLMRVLPTRDAAKRINGTVVIFVGINSQKKAQERIESLHKDKVQAARRYAENIVNTVRDALLVLDDKNQVISANRSFYRMFKTSREQTEGRLLTELGHGQWDIPELNDLLGKLRESSEAFEDYMVEIDFPGRGYRTILLNARRLQREDVGRERVLLAMEDVTGKEKPGGEDEEG